MVNKKKIIPFEFVLDLLHKKGPAVKPMFGCYGVYIREKIIFALRNRESHEEDNGVWIATTSDHHPSLKQVLPSMRSIHMLGNGSTSWQIIPSNSETFEEEVTLACELVLKNDPRIGTIPKKKK